MATAPENSDHTSCEGKNSFIVCHLDKYEQIECVCSASKNKTKNHTKNTKTTTTNDTYTHVYMQRNEDRFFPK